MSVVIVLVFISVIVAGTFLAAFIWSVKSGQYDDDYTPSVRILFDDELTPDTTETTKSTKDQKNTDYGTRKI